MNKTYQHWVCGFLAALLALLALCAGAVYIVDPCLYYRMPERWQPVFFNERYQTAGMVKHVPADTVIMGSSTTANYRAAWVEEVYESSGLRITIPDGHFSEFDQVMDLLYREHSPERIIFALDPNILMRDDRSVTGAMPEYLYNQNPLDDVKYLLNKDCLYYSVYVLLANRQGGGQPLDEGFTSDASGDWGKYAVLWSYDRPLVSEEQIPEDAYLAFVDENLSVMEGWFLAHPDTEFEVFLTPYSILFWDRVIRQGGLDACFKALERACETLTGYPNVHVHTMLFCEGMATGLGNYCDYIHYSGESANWVLRSIRGGKFLLKPENIGTALADWREFVVNYDYDSLWDQEFWNQWYKTHDAPPAWHEGAPLET